MPKLFQINSFCNTGSTGRIAEHLGDTAIANGWQSWIAYGRTMNPSHSNVFKIGDNLDVIWHAFQTRLFDRHGLASKRATRKLVEEIRRVQPDIIHLHNLHGYYLNYPLLFSFLKDYNHPVIWTLHDCWSFTGHCPYFEYENCFLWRSHCHNCPNKNNYPSSLLFDRSFKNFEEKRKRFTSLPNLTIVPVSNWLAEYVKVSFLNFYPVRTIYNGIDTNVFKPNVEKERIYQKYNLRGKYLVIGVAGVWDSRKGLSSFFRLRKLLPVDYDIMVIGVSNKQIAQLPQGVIGIKRTENVEELARIYSTADVLFNPTLEETLSMVNLEAQSCGTPVVSFQTGGCPETIVEGETGYIVPQNDIDKAASYIKQICSKSNIYQESCRLNIIQNFQLSDKYNEYMELYNSLLVK